MAHQDNPTSESETRNGERTYSVRRGVSPDGEVIARGDLLDMLLLNRTRRGQSCVWSDEGRPMTLPKVSARKAVESADAEVGS